MLPPSTRPPELRYMIRSGALHGKTLDWAVARIYEVEREAESRLAEQVAEPLT